MLFQKSLGYHAEANLADILKLLDDTKPTEWKNYAAKECGEIAMIHFFFLFHFSFVSSVYQSDERVWYICCFAHIMFRIRFVSPNQAVDWKRIL